MTYFVFRSSVSTHKPHTKILSDGTIIKGGYEAADNSSALKDALKWAKQCAKSVGGDIWIKSKTNNGKFVKRPWKL